MFQQSFSVFQNFTKVQYLHVRLGAYPGRIIAALYLHLGFEHNCPSHKTRPSALPSAFLECFGTFTKLSSSFRYLHSAASFPLYTTIERFCLSVRPHVSLKPRNLNPEVVSLSRKSAIWCLSPAQWTDGRMDGRMNEWRTDGRTDWRMDGRIDQLSAPLLHAQFSYAIVLEARQDANSRLRRQTSLWLAIDWAESERFSLLGNLCERADCLTHRLPKNNDTLPETMKMFDCWVSEFLFLKLFLQGFE